MILNLSIPGQLAAMREVLDGSWPSWAVTSLPHAFSAATLSGTSGTTDSASTTSATYVDLVSVTGRGIIQLAYGVNTYASTSTTCWLRVEIDGAQLIEMSDTVTTGAKFVYAIGVASGSTPLTGTTAPLLEAIPYTTGFKLQGKRSAGGGNILVRYRYLPMELRA